MLDRLRCPLAVAVVALAPMTPFSRTLGAQPATQPSHPLPPSIATSARGEAAVTPDRATIRIGVETRAPVAATAASENATRLRRVIEALRAAGISAAQIRTVRYDVVPEYTHDRRERSPRPTGYRVANVVQVEIVQADRVGPVLDAALAAGANSVHSIEFSASTIDAARRDAMRRAVERARAAAETLARAAGGSLGRLLELTNVQYDVPGPPRPLIMERAAMAAPAPTPIEFGEQTVWASVTARWQFVPDGG